MNKIKRNDNVMVIAGKDKGVTGKVRSVDTKDDKILVEGANMIKKHARPRKNAKQAGIIDRENAIAVSNVMIVCPKCKKPVRIGFKVQGDKKNRICKSCGEVID
ncbi:MAG: 50S ribosomal protein L24 [Chloroflexi bacterium]|nr:50S ribosomal protein L24 [Chloroflexota bacterium]